MRVKNSFRISNVPMYLGTHNIRWNVCRIYYPVNGAVKRFDIFSTIFDSLSDASPIVQLQNWLWKSVISLIFDSYFRQVPQIVARKSEISEIILQVRICTIYVSTLIVPEWVIEFSSKNMNKRLLLRQSLTRKVHLSDEFELKFPELSWKVSQPIWAELGNSTFELKPS